MSSFLRVYRASALRSAHDAYGERLIRESGFACKAELLAKFASLGARIEEVPVDLDTSRRVGKSKHADRPHDLRLLAAGAPAAPRARERRPHEHVRRSESSAAGSSG